MQKMRGFSEKTFQKKKGGANGGLAGRRGALLLRPLDPPAYFRNQFRIAGEAVRSSERIRLPGSGARASRLTCVYV